MDIKVKNRRRYRRRRINPYAVVAIVSNVAMVVYHNQIIAVFQTLILATR